MKQSQKKQLQKLKRGYKEYGYIALKDYKHYYYLKALPKIISLKNKNRVLCARRKSLIKGFNKVHTTTTIKGVDVRLLSHEDHNKFLLELNKLSEKIGKNSNKIQRLRSQYSKFSDKWVAEKSKPKFNDVY